MLKRELKRRVAELETELNEARAERERALEKYFAIQGQHVRTMVRLNSARKTMVEAKTLIEAMRPAVGLAEMLAVMVPEKGLTPFALVPIMAAARSATEAIERSGKQIGLE